MEESRDLLIQLAAKFNNLSFKEALKKLSESGREMDLAHSTSKEAICDSIAQATRKNKQAESEVERLQLLQSRNSGIFSKKSSERIKLSRKIIELEQENEEMENQLKEMENEISKMENEIRSLSRPSLDELYYEIVRGFGVEFVERDQKTVARVKNMGKNDVFMIECIEENVAEACDKIWASMD